MKCSMCDSKKKLEFQVKNVKYESSGLDNVVIHKAKVYHCDNCGEEYIQYGNLDAIDSAIVEALLKKDDSLTGKEIRFLRTYKGYSGQAFAKRLDVSPEHLYRMEAKNKPVSEKFDRLVRLAYLSLPTDYNYDDIQDMLEGKKEMITFKRINLFPKGDHYSIQFA